MEFKTGTPMNCPVAIQAASAKKPVAWTTAGKSRLSIIWGARMAGPVVTILTEIGNFFGQQFCISASMWSVANCTIFGDRRMFINKRSPFVRMALVTELVDIFSTNHIVSCFGSMRIVTVAALDFPFLNGMV
jgi:hypothetical protein